MEEPDAFQLLTLASARDGRPVSPSIARVWADDLSDVPLDLGVEAVRLHYRESDKWVMPVHILRNAARIRDQRALERGPEFCRQHDGYPVPCERCAREEQDD